MKDRYLMDQHKLLWHLDRVNEYLNNGRIVPLHIDFGITTGCNMACRYCYGVIQGRTGPKGFNMPREAIFGLFKDAKDVGVRSIAIIGEGENTLNPALYDAVDYAKKIDLDVGLATNGIAIKKDRIMDLLKSLVWIRFNISAATPSSYSEIHGVTEKTFAIVIDNIKACVETKRKHGLKTTIGLQMVLLQENMNDIVPLAKLGKELGVDYLVIKPCSDTFDKKLKSPTNKYLEIEDVLKEAENCSDEKYIVSVKWQKLGNLGLKDFKVCYGTQFIIGISGNGDVFPCGHFFNIRREEFLMGNIIEKSFKEIVSSERYWGVQKKIQSLDVNKECETNCRQYYVSQFLWKLKNQPEHVNFI